jgi:acyl dehydratase
MGNAMTAHEMIEKQRAALGKPSLPSRWRTVRQEDIDQFGRCTDDMDPMHVDPEWATRESSFGGTIAFGFWTLAMLTTMIREIAGTSLDSEGVPAHIGVNYGLNRVRFIEPVPVGSRIRAIATPVAMDESKPGRILTTLEIKVEVEGRDRPALTAEWLSLTILPELSGALDGFRSRG